MKLKAWMVYLLGFPVIYGISNTMLDHYDSLSIVGVYLFWGSIGIGIYYLTHWIWFRKQNDLKKINN